MAYDRDRDTTFLGDLIKRAKSYGADAADAVMFDQTSINVGQRLGKPETIERSESQEIGLRVFVGTKVANVSTGDRKPESIQTLVE